MPRKDKRKPAGETTAPTSQLNNRTSITATDVNPPSSPPVTPIWRSLSTQKAFYLVILAAIYAPLSQLVLAPVYGSIPASQYHQYGLYTSALLAFLIKGYVPTWVDKFLPAFVFWIPTIHFALFQYSSVLGNPIGPLVTEMATTFPLITLSLYLANKVFSEADLSFLNNSDLAESGPSMFFYLIFNLAQRLFRSTLPKWIGSNFLNSRVGTQITVAICYGLLLPQSTFWPAVPSILFTFTGNTHNRLQRTSIILENTLALYNYTLLERHESVTGYISVLQDESQQFRIMRCDHSLLGGEWTIPPPPGTIRRVPEPIYAVFTMLEAVRLIEPPPAPVSSPDASTNSPHPRALTIGLGTGTVQSALIAHGIHTTVLELDPMIHYLAGRYFNLPGNHSYLLGDAAEAVASASTDLTRYSGGARVDKMYDYIVHDAFTGGAVPVDLFTKTFLTQLATLLKPTGAITINYAGDLNDASAALVYRTIASVFPSCRLFREDDPNSPSPTSTTTSPNKPKGPKAEDQEDFTNLIFFCHPPTSPRSSPVTFRRPNREDYLSSPSREIFLMPRHEVDPLVKFARHLDTNSDDRGGDVGVLDTGNRKALGLMRRWQAKSAAGHWRLMRGVVRDEVWENW